MSKIWCAELVYMDNGIRMNEHLACSKSLTKLLEHVVKHKPKEDRKYIDQWQDWWKEAPQDEWITYLKANGGGVLQSLKGTKTYVLIAFHCTNEII